MAWTYPHSSNPRPRPRSTGPYSELINAQSGSCLYTNAAANVGSGFKPTMAPCRNIANQSGQHRFRLAASVYAGEQGKCMGASGSAAGSAAELAGCANVATQYWAGASDGTVRIGSACLTEAGTTARSGLTLGSCSGAAATKWTMAGPGPMADEIQNLASGLCVTVPSWPIGTRLVLGTCSTAFTSTWHVE